jgi:hypothetical protein
MDTAHDLADRLASLLRNERHAMAEFLVALADFDGRKAWMRLGHASLFTFLHRDLGLSKGASHFRKVAAELIQRYPEVVEPLRDGRLCMLWNDRSTAPNVRSFRPDQAALETAQFDG